MSAAGHPRPDSMKDGAGAKPPRPADFTRVVWLLAAVTAVIAAYITGRLRSERVYAESTSPDGALRVVITERTPFFLSSPHVYRFSLQSVEFGGTYTGFEHIRDTDSVVLGPCQFTWNGPTVIVETPQSSPRKVTAQRLPLGPWSKGSFGGQQWEVTQ